MDDMALIIFADVLTMFSAHKHRYKLKYEVNPDTKHRLLSGFP